MAYADRPDIVNGWGTPADDLIPLAVNMARRESGIDYAVDRNERPAIQLSVPPSDRGEFDTVSTSVNRQATRICRPLSQMLSTATTTCSHSQTEEDEPNIWSGPHPWKPASPSSTGLDQHWTRATGSPPVESADLGQRRIRGRLSP